MSPNRKRSKVIILIEFLFDATLLLIFAVQALLLGCLLTYGHIPIPKNWASQQLTPHLPEGFRIEAETIRLRLNGQIELSNAKVWTGSIKQPIFQSDGVVVQLDWDQSYKPIVYSVVVSNGTLQLPGVYSPTGLDEPILEKIAFRLKPKKDLVEIDSFAALHDSIHFRGSIEWPLKPTEQRNLDQQDLVNRFYQKASVVMAGQDRLEMLTNPTLLFKLSENPDKSVKLITRLSSIELNHEQAYATNIKLDAEFKIKDGKATALSPLKLSTDTLVSEPYTLQSTGLHASISTEDLSALLNKQAPRVSLHTERLAIHDIELESPILKLDPRDLPIVRFFGATNGLNGAFELGGDVDTNDFTGSMYAKGSVDLLALLPDEIATTLPPIEFSEAPYYDLKVELDEKLAITTADLKVDTYGVTLANLFFDHIDARATYKDDIYTLKDVHIRRNNQWVDLQFSLDSKTWDYKSSLIGSAIPQDYNQILPAWWAKIFKDLDFKEVINSHGDFVINGNIKDMSSITYYGHARAQNARYRGVRADKASLIVRGKDRHTKLTNISAQTDQGWAKGDISFTSLRDEIKKPVSIRLAFDGQLHLDDIKKLFGDQIAKHIHPFTTENLPYLEIEAAIFSSAYPKHKNDTYFNLLAQATGPVTFKNIPLRDLSFSLYGRPNSQHLRDIQFIYADGSGDGTIDITYNDNTSPIIHYSINLDDADQSEAIRNLPTLDHVEGELTSKPEGQATDSDREDARVHLTLHAQGPTDNLYQHSGYGEFTINNKDIGSIQLLGPLSRMLKNTKFNFTSFNLGTMHAAFELQEDLIHFHQLQIDGPRTRILSPGSMTLRDQELDMRVTVNLFANVGSPDSPLRKVGSLITSPIPNLLIFELTGTVKEQKWRSLYDPRKLIPKL